MKKQQKFIDEVTIKISSGKGGDGALSFRREKFIPKGGPDGGDGGDGGSVIFVAESNISTLLDFKFQPLYKAEDGGSGQKRSCKGKAGADLYLRVPVGTEIIDIETGRLVADLIHSGDQFVSATGGFHGFGNKRFKSSTNRAPRKTTKGKAGVVKDILLRLKLIADVGIIGCPNAGKSTLIANVTDAKPQIGDYPFTTITPNLGIVKISPEKRLTFADIPGLIDGAAEGKGLGSKFLKHIERTRVLIHLLDPVTCKTNDELVDSFKDVSGELASFSAKLTKFPQVVTLNKIDRITDKRLDAIKKLFQDELNIELSLISAINKLGVDQLILRVEKLLDSYSDQE
ncbi:MAG: Obg family GTPase CgtA [Nitrospinota bacterium]